MALKRHSFPEICKTGCQPGQAGNICKTFQPLFTNCIQHDAAGHGLSEHDGDRQSEDSLAKRKEDVRKEGMLKGRQAAILDVHTQCAGEMISLVECILDACRRYSNRKKELIEAAGHWIVALADQICQKVVGYELEADKQRLSEALGNWIEACIYEDLPAEITADDTLQFLFSAAEMMLPCEQKTARQMQWKLEQLRNLPESFLPQVEKKPPVGFAEQLAGIFKDNACF